MRYLLSQVGVSILVVRVMDSPGLSQVLVGGACSRARLHTILGIDTVSADDVAIALDWTPVL